jgi:hypothetical protein
VTERLSRVFARMLSATARPGCSTWSDRDHIDISWIHREQSIIFFHCVVMLAGPEQLRFAKMERHFYVKRRYTRGEVVARGQDQNHTDVVVVCSIGCKCPIIMSTTGPVFAPCLCPLMAVPRVANHWFLSRDVNLKFEIPTL